MMAENHRQTLSSWIRGTLIGHLVGCQLFYSLPMLIVFTYFLHTDGDLTIGNFLRLVPIMSLGGALFAVLFWYTVTDGLLKKYRSKK